MTPPPDQYATDEPEGSQVGKNRITPKQVLVIVVILAVLAILFYPILEKMKKDGERKICSTNIQQVSKAILIYAEEYDERIPPTHVQVAGGAPLLQDGYPVAWPTTIQDYVTGRAGFGCPAAPQEAHARIYSSRKDDKGENEVIECAFGLYLGVATMPTSHLATPNATVMIAGSATGGFEDTYNPYRFEYEDGTSTTNDGFLLGYDNPLGNFEIGPDAEKITRLAFRNTGDGDFTKDTVRSRHEDGILAIRADGSLGVLTPTDAILQKVDDDDLAGIWRVR